MHAKPSLNSLSSQGRVADFFKQVNVITGGHETFSYQFKIKEEIPKFNFIPLGKEVIHRLVIRASNAKTMEEFITPSEKVGQEKRKLKLSERSELRPPSMGFKRDQKATQGLRNLSGSANDQVGMSSRRYADGAFPNSNSYGDDGFDDSAISLEDDEDEENYI